MDQSVTVALLIAATIPFAVSIVSALSAKTRVKNVDEYFLFQNKLDVDSFIKTTIGYSLQVAAIFLFIYWTQVYGIIVPLLVCISWSLGYFIISRLLECGKLDDLLNTATFQEARMPPRTIHGFIGSRVYENRKISRVTVVLFASVASVIGLGGTMMTEIDYTTTYSLAAISGANGLAIDGVATALVSVAILAFTSLYVLWGGYKAVVFTDRFQVPVAYVAFALFALMIGLHVTSNVRNVSFGLATPSLIVILGIIYGVIGWIRISQANHFRDDPNFSSNRVSTVVTFVPIVVLCLIFLIGKSAWFNSLALQRLWEIAFPINAFGLGLLGIISLVFVNSAWQLVDISSLQRLQSLDRNSIEESRAGVAKAIRWTGVEACFGWITICVVGLIIKDSGFDTEFVTKMMADGSVWLKWCVIVFIFTAAVYMLSTISGFISAISYISFYDIVPFIQGRPIEVDAEKLERSTLQSARMTTIAAISLVSILYMVLKTNVRSDQISSILYAIYAFQIVIFPSVLAALFGRKSVQPVAAAFSMFAGMIVAYVAAMHPNGWRVLEGFGGSAESWGVMPPFLSSMASLVVYSFSSIIENRVEMRRLGKEA